MQPSRSVLALSATVALSCAHPPVPPAPAAPAEAHATGEGFLLAFPVADAESLLGRPVHTTGDGAWTIADQRLPGCEVRAQRAAASFKSKRRVALHTMASISAGFSKVLGLEASHGTDVMSDIAVDNSGIIEADTRGACGDVVVDKVFVGHGSRTLLREAAANVGGAAESHTIALSGSYDSASQVIDSTEWMDDQAYAFTFRSNPASASLALTVELPATLTRGEEVHATFSTNRPAYLSVFYLEADGSGDVLWPSREEPEPRSSPGTPAHLPSEREVASGVRIRATLRDPNVEARETLVVYAFSELEDYRKLRPEVGGTAKDGASYAALLTDKLQSVPLSRWARAVVGYTIRPAR